MNAMKGTGTYVSPFLWLREDTGFSQFNVEVTRIGEEWQGGPWEGLLELSLEPWWNFHNQGKEKA